MIDFLERTKDDVLTLEAHPGFKIEWYVDAAFAVHNDFKGHTGAVMMLGKGCIQSVSTKQKVNARSSTEAELIALDDVISKILWTKRFLENQGIEIQGNIVYRDNMSSMKLEKNGFSSAGKRSRHLDIKYFYVKDLIERKELSTEHCGTDQMLADYFTKPLTGTKFDQLRKTILNLP